MTSVVDGLSAQHARIAAACERSGRSPGDVSLIAVSKGHGVEAIRAAYAAGQRDFGENYIQEWREKAAALSDLDVRWHIIGHLQSNKVRELVGQVTLIHTVDRAKLAREIDKRFEAPVDALLEVNVGGETAKHGCAPDEAARLLAAVATTERVRPTGLMTVAPYFENPEDVRPSFRALRNLFDTLRHDYPALTHLSMGMSHDMEVAVEEGATLVRVGTAIFGARNYT